MKTYVITLSKTFMKGSPRAGESTGFRRSLEKALQTPFDGGFRKIHTIWRNVPLWRKRIEEVRQGEACLSIREWTGKPYASKQEEIARLTKEDGVGLQIIQFENIIKEKPIKVYDTCGNFRAYTYAEYIANNDGLGLEDWLEWFKGCKADENLAIIHFTKFRY